MEHNVFEPVSGRGANDESRTGFDDSTTKLYRFIDEDSKENKYHDDNSQCDESSSSSKDSKSRYAMSYWLIIFSCIMLFYVTYMYI